jgi:hypothetical protein
VGKQVDVLNGYKEAELLSRKGKGCLTHMWFGGNWSGYEKTHIPVARPGRPLLHTPSWMQSGTSRKSSAH